MALDATAKGTSANSYVLNSEAETYFGDRSDVADWVAASTTDEDKALVTATSVLDLEEYDGFPTTTTQRLQWPRSGIVNRVGQTVSSDTIYRAVKEATFELALAIIKGEFTLSDTGLEGFRNVKVGSLDVTPNLGRPAVSLPEIVVKLLRPVRLGASGINVPAARG